MNQQGLMSGHTDTPLADEGHSQAKKAGQAAKESGLSFDIIVSSPLQRAHHTAKHVAQHVGYPEDEIVLDSQFKERSFGSMEGAKMTSLLGARYFLNESYIDDQPEVETLQQLQDRADAALKYLHSLDHEVVLVVAHGAFGRALYRAVNNLPITKRDIRYNNAEIVRFI